MHPLLRLLKDGQDAIEYAILLAVVAFSTIALFSEAESTVDGISNTPKTLNR
jgi:Flp pilus assembly pilin Flp